MKIVAISASALTHQQERYSEIGFDAFIAKPFLIATAQAYNITDFVSIDRDFLRVDGITVYTCLPP